MDKSTQVQVSYDDIPLVIENKFEGRYKTKKVNYKSEVSAKKLMYRHDDCSVQGPGDLVRFWSVGEDMSTVVDDYYEVKSDQRLEDEFSFSATTPKLTLVRGSSLSLVDIPTFLSSSVTLGTISTMISNTFPPYDPRKSLAEKLAKYRANRSEPKMGKRSQWTVMCVALGFFGSCLILVGGMLSITSDYQDRAIARMLNMSVYNEDIKIGRENGFDGA